MNLDDSDAEHQFRLAARAFVSEQGVGYGDRRQHMFVVGEKEEQEFLAHARTWQRVKFDHGWAGIVWPTDVGGRGGTVVENAIFQEEEARAVSPWMTHSLGIDIAGPAVNTFGSEEQRRQHLPRMLRGEAVWCQLFSEPSAGSDLGGVRTTAKRAGDAWLVNGQKIWSSKAHFADWGFLVTRTNWDVPKYSGITCFVIDMGSAGVDARPIRQINGSSHFDEVFLTDVLVPDENRVGGVDEGWAVAMGMLSGERNLQGDVARGVPFDDLVDLARQQGVVDDPLIRQQLASCYARREILRYLGLRSWTAAARGVAPGPEASVTKLAASIHTSETAALVMNLLGAEGLAMGPEATDGGRWIQEYLDHFAQKVGGGTDEIQRTMIGERVLGLPRDLRVDKNVPFHELPAQ